MSTLTGLKDTDKLVLNELSDRDLLNMCKTDKYFAETCRNETFWRERFLRYFGPHAAKYKPKNRSWRKHYLRVIRDINILNNGKVKETLNRSLISYNWRFFSILRVGTGTPPLVYNFPYEDYIKANSIYNSIYNFNRYYVDASKSGKIPLEKDETATNIYWMAPLTGNEKSTIKLRYGFPWNAEDEDNVLEYSLDYFNSLGDMWTYPRYFTPAKVVKIIEDFYNSKPKGEELDRIGRILIEEHIDRETVETMTYLEIARVFSPESGKISGMYVYPKGPTNIDDPLFQIFVPMY